MEKRNKLQSILALFLSLCLIVLMASPAQAAVSINKKSAALYVGETVTLALKGTKQKTTWSTNKSAVATVNSKGKVTAKKAGTATITAKCHGKKYSCKVTVKKKPAPTGRLNYANVTMSGGSYIQLKLIGVSGTPKWSSSNSSVAVVDNKGLVTGAKKGRAVIYAKLNGKTYSTKITVSSDAKAPVQKTPSGNIRVQAPKAAESILNAFEQLHFQLVYNSAVSYTGYTDCRNQTVTMKYQSDAIYHELGHFLAFIAGNADYTSEWRAIYQAEKNKYTKFNKGYVCATQYEYFAESYKDYVLSKTELRQQRPQTYQYIVKTLQTANTRNATTGFWKNMHDNYARIGIWTR